MEGRIIIIPENPIIITEDKIKEGDKFYSYIEDEDGYKKYSTFTCLKEYKDKFNHHYVSVETGRDNDETKHFIFDVCTCYKIIAGLDVHPSIDYNGFENKLGIIDINKLAYSQIFTENIIPTSNIYGQITGFVKGYKFALKEFANKISMEELLNLINSITEFISHKDPEYFDEWIIKKINRLIEYKSYYITYELVDYNEYKILIVK